MSSKFQGQNEVSICFNLVSYFSPSDGDLSDRVLDEGQVHEVAEPEEVKVELRRREEEDCAAAADAVVLGGKQV